MKPLLPMVLSLAVLPLAGVAIAAENSAVSKPATGEKVEVIDLSIHPCQPPHPALTYSLLPGYLERTPGNAVPVYDKSFIFLGVNVAGKEWYEMQKWLDMPLASLPREEVRRKIVWYSPTLHGIEIAAHRDHCEWDPPIREASRDVFGMLLPETQAARLTARLVGLRARLEIAEKKYDEAMASLRTGYCLARHIAEQQLLVPSVVGLSLGRDMDDRLQEMLVQPDAPSLYWAISAMPHPLIDLRPAMEVEGNAVYVMFPEMQPSRRGDLSPERWTALAPQILSDVADLVHYFRPVPRATAGKGKFVAKLMKAVPEAKADLIAAGHPKRKVEAMVPGQAVLLDMFEIYETRRDDLFKWFSVPYWQAGVGLREGEARIVNSGKNDGLASLATTLLRAVGAAHKSNARVERRRAALCCVEAIRLYAGAHEGRLPANLDAIHEVPIPINPVTGKSFLYHVEGQVAVLEADGPAEWETENSARQQYRLRVVK
ncbi:MAG: hypothetical protein ACLQNE_41085 [Thermoguttaceae bacterium]